MDVNGTRFHVLLGRSDWGRCTDESGRALEQSWERPAAVSGAASTLAWDEDRHELTLRSFLYELLESSSEPLELDRRRGAARDHWENWYWIDADRSQIRFRSAGAEPCSPAVYWPVPTSPRASVPGAFVDAAGAPESRSLKLSALTVTTLHYLVVGTLDPAGLLVFDLYAGGSPEPIFWTHRPFAPFDMAPTPDGGVAILDRTNRCAWVLDRWMNVLPRGSGIEGKTTDDFGPVGRPRERTTHSFGKSDLSLPLAGDPVAIEALPDGTFLVLDHLPRVHRYDHEGALLEGPLPLDLGPVLAPGAREREAAPLVAHDFVFVPGQGPAGVPGQLYLAPAGGIQAFAFRLDLKGSERSMVIEPMSLFLPLRQFGGKGLVSAGGTAWYDFADGWVPLVEHRRSAYAPDATLFAPGSPSPRGGPGPAADAGLNREHDDGEGAFDGREPGCVWHRLLIDAVLPSPAHVRIWSRAADEKRDLEAAPWFEEPPLGRRRSGPERAFLPDQPPPGGTYETLFQRARGRWLQLKLRLSSEGQARPRLFSLRVTYPRFSYLREYLPAIYRDDVESASFLDRFLANLEGLYTTIEERIAAVHLLLDPRSAPGEALPWLAAWLGVALDPSWEERRRRFFIAHAMQSFRSRGTARGIRAALHLAFGDVVEESLFSGDLPSLWSHDRIKLLEGSRLRQVPGSVRRSSEGIDDEGGAAHRFEVLLPLRPNGVTPSAKPARAGRPESRAQSLALAKRIIELAKPAHTTFQVRFYWEMFRVGEARVGLDRLLDSSSRVPELLPVLPLGSGALSQAWLAPLPGAGARTILGRDTLP